MSPTRSAARKVKLGYAVSSEEHRPLDLVRNTAAAEEAGFDFAMVSDHFHPWIDRQGQAPFVWSVLGAMANATERIPIGTGVTCPTIRIHPAILAQAAATMGELLPDRFWFGVGTGENLNEHVLGDRWPAHGERAAMLEEAVEVIRELWKGKLTNMDTPHYRVVNATIYTRPKTPPPIYVAASGPESAALAGRIGDGLITTSPTAELVDAFRKAGGRGKPLIGQVSVCWAKSQAEARRTALDWWPTAAIPGQNGQELPMPSHFEELATMVTEDDVAKQMPCGPDPESHLAKINEFVDAGFDHVYIHQVGPDQAGFLRFARQSILPAFERRSAGRGAAA